MTICIMGTPVNCGNRGVIALGTSLINLCSQASQGGDVVLLLGNRDNQPAPVRLGDQLRFVPVVHARMSPRSRPRHHLLWILLMSVVYRLVPVGGARAVIARSTPWIKAVAEADFVGDIRGGDSFSDIYGMRGFLVGFLMAWTALLVRGSMVQFPQTYGPYASPIARGLARFLLRRSSTIIARDRESQRVAQELAGPGRPVLLSPDVAFSLEAVRPVHVELDPPLPPTGRQTTDYGLRTSNDSGKGQSSNSREQGPSHIPDVQLSDLQYSTSPPPRSPISDLRSPNAIGINVNGLMYNGGYTRKNMFGLKLDYAAFVPALIEALLQKTDGDIWLVPHTYAPSGNVESDPEACRRVRDALSSESQKRVRIVTTEYDCHEIKGVIGMCDFFIGSRMHSCIAALSQGIPCIGVAYSMKFAGVFESVGLEDWVIDGRTVDNEAAIARVVELYRQRDSVRESLASRADEARERLKKIFHWLVATSGGTKNLESVPHPDSTQEQVVLQNVPAT